MSTQSNKSFLKKFISQHFQKVEAKDIDSVLSDYNDDAEFIDPHYLME